MERFHRAVGRLDRGRRTETPAHAAVIGRRTVRATTA
jgi:hypothetical protein